MRPRLVAVLLVPVLLLAGCGEADDPVVTSDRTTTTSDSTTTTSAPGATTGGFAESPLPASAPAGTTRAYLKAVRLASHDGYDRVVFEFEDALPGYRVDTTTRPVREDGSGDQVEVEGDVLLQARFENAATARIEGERVVPVYTGPRRVPGPGTVVAEAVDAGDFEGLVTWVVGLESRRRPHVRVTTLESPYRVVVDVRADS